MLWPVRRRQCGASAATIASTTAVRLVGGRGVGLAGVHAEPERLRLDPDARRGRAVAASACARSASRSAASAGSSPWLDGAFARDPELRAVRAGQQQRRVVGVLGDDPQVGEAAPRDERDDRVGRGDERIDRGARGRQHPRVHRLVLERRERAVEVERDEQAIGCRDRARSRVASSACTRVIASPARVARGTPPGRSRKSTATSRATSCSITRRRSARMRRPCSAAGISIARMIASFSPSMSCGLMRTALPSSSAAPANSLSTSTPRLSTRAATYSFATRFMPSRSAVTSMTSAARYSATISSRG